MKIILHNITEANTQLKTELNCIVICHQSVKLKKIYPKITILCIVMQLYGLGKVGNLWFIIYLDYYKERLDMKMSFYDICLPFTSKIGVKTLM